MNQKLTAILGLLLALSLVSCATAQETTTPDTTTPDQTQTETPTPDPSPDQPTTPEGDPIEVLMLTGPTGMGAAKLMTDAQEGTTAQNYNFTTVDANDQVSAMLISGEADIAAISTSVAATLYNKGQEIQILAVNTLGVLYLLEKGGEEIQSLADLRGKTIWTTGQGANPEYILNHLLVESGLTPQTDVTIEYMTAQEVATKMATEDKGIAMLPVPASTALLLADDGVREAIDLSAEWTKFTETELPMGAVVARTEFIEEHPEEVELFLEEYKDSIAYMANPQHLSALEGEENPAEMVANFSITPSVAVATKALPKANITYREGAAMQSSLQLYFGILYNANPDSIGGGLPYDDFYYGG
ncbi:MAG: MqnA/MqnD/SBP family protein [Eubacteriales bacterium]